MIFAYLLLCLITGSFQLITELKEPPRAIESGEEVELSCTYTLTEGERADVVKWWWISNNGTRVQIYQRFTDSPPQILKHDFNSTIQDNDKLILSGLTPKYSGLYECEVSSKPSMQEVRTGQLVTVYTKGSGPKLRVTELEQKPLTEGESKENPEDALLLVECEASGVAPKPDMAISIEGKELNLTDHIEYEDDFFNITTNTTITKSEADSRELNCEMFYVDASINHLPYIDTFTYQISESEEASPQQEAPAAARGDEPAPEPLSPPGDSSCHLYYSVVLLSVLTLATLCNNLSWQL